MSFEAPFMKRCDYNTLAKGAPDGTSRSRIRSDIRFALVNILRFSVITVVSFVFVDSIIYYVGRFCPMHKKYTRL